MLYARIRWTILNMSKRLFGFCVLNNVHPRTPAYIERTRRMSNVPLTYISVFERMCLRPHTWCYKLQCYCTLKLFKCTMHSHEIVSTIHQTSTDLLDQTRKLAHGVWHLPCTSCSVSRKRSFTMYFYSVISKKKTNCWMPNTHASLHRSAVIILNHALHLIVINW